MPLVAREAGLGVAGLHQSRVYDRVMRLPMLGWSAFAAAAQIAALGHYVRAAEPAPAFWLWAVNLAMRASTIAFLLLVAASVIVRAPPTERARGVEPRVSALLGTFLTSAISLFPRRDLPVTAQAFATVLIFLGSIGAAAALLRLGRSFSVMAEARHLVTTGPYRIVRHPLYLAEEIATIGLFVQFLSLGTALLVALQIAFQLRRMHNEERVLSASFPEYADYRQKTARLLPGLY